MKQVTFTILTTLSLLLFTAITILWIRSFYLHDLRVSKHGKTQTSFASCRGAFHHCRVTSAFTHLPQHQGTIWQTRSLRPADTLDHRYGQRTRDLRFAGFAWIEGDWREGFRSSGEPPLPYRATVIPYWPLALLAAIPPLLHLRSHLRRRRRASTHRCTHCGYDLRATPERCPECGHAPALRTSEPNPQSQSTQRHTCL